MLLYFAPSQIVGNPLGEYTYTTTVQDGVTGITRKAQALALGLGSLFNHADAHSRAHNLDYSIDKSQGTITYRTLREIDAGEELCIWYGADVGWMTLGDGTRDGHERGRMREASLERGRDIGRAAADLGGIDL
ncbi:hypothetical protein PYCC9005_001685 [Savitreella phatthalungensis]